MEVGSSGAVDCPWTGPLTDIDFSTPAVTVLESFGLKKSMAAAD